MDKKYGKNPFKFQENNHANEKIVTADLAITIFLIILVEILLSKAT
jgi:hypothetical protein